jgi:hypothetical protein
VIALTEQHIIIPAVLSGFISDQVHGWSWSKAGQFSFFSHNTKVYDHTLIDTSVVIKFSQAISCINLEQKSSISETFPVSIIRECDGLTLLVVYKMSNLWPPLT